MAEELPVICSACGGNLGPPDQEVEHPDDTEPPEDAHFKVQIRDDGAERLQCKTSGKLGSPTGSQDDNYVEIAEKRGREDLLEILGVEGGPEPTKEPEKSDDRPAPTPPDDSPKSAEEAGVYEVDEDKDQLDILEEVVTNPSYGLDDDQIKEIQGWAVDYGGQMPPDALQEIAANMQGVQKQTASLMRQRYELKLNKWMREQSESNGGPGIGISTLSHPAAAGSSPPSPSSQSGPSREAMAAVEERQERRSRGATPEEEEHDSEIKKAREERKNRREERRDRRRDAIDSATEELAVGAAQNVADEAGEGIVRTRNIFLRLLEAKAEKDPDWFFEKFQQIEENLGIDPWTLLEPSEAERRRQEQQQQKESQPGVDNEVDDVLDELGAEDVTTKSTPTEQVDAQQPEQQQAENEPEPPEPEPEPEEEGNWGNEEEGEFEEIFGE